jgi:hypothetical protein
MARVRVHLVSRKAKDTYILFQFVLLFFRSPGCGFSGLISITTLQAVQVLLDPGTRF